MTRQSTNIYNQEGTLIHGFDYDIQVWVENGVVLDCAHPDSMKEQGCCAAHKYAGLPIGCARIAADLPRKERQPRGSKVETQVCTNCQRVVPKVYEYGPLKLCQKCFKVAEENDWALDPIIEEGERHKGGE